LSFVGRIWFVSGDVYAHARLFSRRSYPSVRGGPFGVPALAQVGAHWFARAGWTVTARDSGLTSGRPRVGEAPIDHEAQPARDGRCFVISSLRAAQRKIERPSEDVLPGVLG